MGVTGLRAHRIGRVLMDGSPDCPGLLGPVTMLVFPQSRLLFTVAPEEAFHSFSTGAAGRARSHDLSRCWASRQISCERATHRARQEAPDFQLAFRPLVDQ